MKPAATSREEILSASKQLVSEKGWNALSIRSVAAACQVSIGCLYNYFPSKNELVGATVVDIWKEIFHLPPGCMETGDLRKVLKQWYVQMEEGSRKYPAFASLHSALIVNDEREEGSELMYRAWNQISRTITKLIEQDPAVNPDRLDASFQPEQAAQVLFSLMISSIVREDYDPTLILETTKRLLF